MKLIFFKPWISVKKFFQFCCFFRIAVNNRLESDEPVLSDGDEVAYLPPFAGG